MVLRARPAVGVLVLPHYLLLLPNQGVGAPHPPSSVVMSMRGTRGTFSFLPQLFIEPTMCQAVGSQSLFNIGNVFINTLISGPVLKNWKLWQYWACFPWGQQSASARRRLPASESVSHLWFASPVVSHTRSALFPHLAMVVIYLSLQALTQVVTIVNTHKRR